MTRVEGSSLGSRILTRFCCVESFRNYQAAIRLMQRATSTPKKPKGINFYDDVSDCMVSNSPLLHRTNQPSLFIFYRVYLFKLDYSNR